MSAAAAEEPTPHGAVPFADASPSEVRAALIPEEIDWTALMRAARGTVKIAALNLAG